MASEGLQGLFLSFFLVSPLRREVFLGKSAGIQVFFVFFFDDFEGGKLVNVKSYCILSAQDMMMDDGAVVDVIISEEVKPVYSYL